MGLLTRITTMSPRLLAVVKTVMASVVERGLTIVIGLVTVPLSLSYLGASQYGLWATITSFVGLFAFADLGIGYGVMNAVAAATGRDDRREVRSVLSNGLAMLLVAGAIILGVFALTYPFLQWERILGVDDPADVQVARAAMIVLAVLFAVNIPLGLVQRLQYGLQRGYLNSVVQLTGSVTGLLLILAVIRLDLGLTGMVGMFLIAPMLATIAVAVWMMRKDRDLVPDVSLVRLDAMKRLLQTGGMFFVIQMSASLAFASDNLIIAQVLGTEAVASYAVHQKLFSPVQAMVAFIMTPLWPAYTEAIARGDIRWVRLVLARSAAVLGVGSLVGTLLLLWQADWLMHLWLRGKMDVQAGLCVALTVWITVDSIGKAFSMFLNGAGILKQQLYITLAFVPLCLTLKVLFAGWFGVQGLPWAMAIAWSVTHVPSYFVIIRNWLRDHAAQPADAARPTA